MQKEHVVESIANDIPAFPPPYCLQQDSNTGRWLVVNSRDPQWIWSGAFWIDRDRGAARLAFPNPMAAEAYCKEVFRDRRNPSHA